VERRAQDWRCTVRHVEAKGKAASRGATTLHASLNGALEAMAEAARAAERCGWRRVEARGGFTSKPDAFTLDTLPRPKGTAPKAATKKK
jgi:hypothetical protein